MLYLYIYKADISTLFKLCKCKIVSIHLGPCLGLFEDNITHMYAITKPFLFFKLPLDKERSNHNLYIYVYNNKCISVCEIVH